MVAHFIAFFRIRQPTVSRADELIHREHFQSQDTCCLMGVTYSNHSQTGKDMQIVAV